MKAYYKKHQSVVYKPTIGVRFAVNVINCMKSVLESFVDSNSVTFCFCCFVVWNYCFVHFGFLVYVCQLIFSQRFSSTLTLLFWATDKRNSIGFSVFATDLVISNVWVRNSLLASTIMNWLIGSFFNTDCLLFASFEWSS